MAGIIDPMTFKEKLLRECERRGWKVAELARQIDEPATTVSNWINAGTLPNIQTGSKIARRLGLPLEYLADDTLLVPAVATDSDLTDDERSVIKLVRLLGVEPRDAARAIASVAAAAQLRTTEGIHAIPVDPSKSPQYDPTVRLDQPTPTPRRRRGGSEPGDT
jgi:transcriptional regulator with XRE-family HTH domain